MIRAYDPHTLEPMWEHRMADITWGGVLAPAEAFSAASATQVSSPPAGAVMVSVIGSAARLAETTPCATPSFTANGCCCVKMRTC